MNEINVTVIIPNWNGKELLKDCLDSLSKQSYENFIILVVDNGSTDGSVEYIKSLYKKVEVLELDKNYGFTGAINRGVKYAKTEFVALLNNDTEVDSHWLQELVKTINQHLEVASVGSKLLNYFQRDIIDGVGIELNEVGQARSIGYQQKDHGQFDIESYVFGATAGAALFRREVFLELGGFDDNYFMYSEEVDWAFKAQFLGYKSIFAPKALVYHKHKMSSKKVPQYIEYWQFRNMYQTIIKDYPLGLLLKRWRWLKILLVYGNTVFYQFKNGFLWPPILTTLWLFVHLPQLIYKRWKTQTIKRVSDEYIDAFLIAKRVTLWGILK